MKRSVAIEEIVRTFSKPIEGSPEKFPEALATAILDRLEQLGMKPPTYKKVFPCTYEDGTPTTITLNVGTDWELENG